MLAILTPLPSSQAALKTLESERVLEARRGDLAEEGKARIQLLEAQVRRRPAYVRVCVRAILSCMCANQTSHPYPRAQLNEEQARRRRSEDRVRVLKEYGERTKARGAELEAALAAAEAAHGEAKGLLARARTEGRELGRELGDARAAQAAQEEEVARQRARAENAEYLQRNLRLDGDRLREEAGQQRRDLQAAQEQQQRTHAELELLRQRYASRTAEQHMRDLSSSSSAAPSSLPLPPPSERAVKASHSSSNSSGEYHQQHMPPPAAPAPERSRDTDHHSSSTSSSSSSFPYGQAATAVAADTSGEEEEQEEQLQRRPPVRPHYQLPPAGSSRQPLHKGSGGRGATAMGIKRRVAGGVPQARGAEAGVSSSFLMEADSDSEEEREGLDGRGCRRGEAASLEEALVTQDLGYFGVPAAPAATAATASAEEEGEEEGQGAGASLEEEAVLRRFSRLQSMHSR